MPGLFDPEFEQDIDAIINSTIHDLEEGVEDYWNYRTGFFTPYRSVGDFASTLVAPVVEPVVSSIAFAAASAVFVSALGASAFCLGVATVSAIGGSDDGVVLGLTLAAMSVLAAAISAAIALVALLAVVISIPASCLSIVTRSLATVGDAIFCDNDCSYGYSND